MKTTKITFIAALLLASAVIISSCKKKTTTTPPDTDTSTATDNNLAESVSNDAVTMTGQASESGSLSYRLGNNSQGVLSTCAQLVIDTSNKVLTVNFGTLPCLCADGHLRSGIIKFDYHTSTNGAHFLRNPGFVCVITTTGYMVDGNAVTINKTITNTTPTTITPTTNLTWTDVSSVTIVKANSGGTVTWACNRILTLMNTNAITYAGQAVGAAYTDQNHPIIWFGTGGNAAVTSTSGTANGTDSKGVSYSFTTTSPLVVNMNCSSNSNHPAFHPIVQGAFDFTPGSKATRHVDFGSGTCDNTLTVTINGISYTITIN